MVSKPAVVIVAVVAMLFSTNAHAQFGRNRVHYDRLDFRLLQTPHFDIYYYSEEEEAVGYAAQMAERWYSRFSRILHHTFAHRQPLILYASHSHFTQTNLAGGPVGEGVGGFTEHAKSRIALPFTPGLGETDHILGHVRRHLRRPLGPGHPDGGIRLQRFAQALQRACKLGAFHGEHLDQVGAFAVTGCERYAVGHRLE